MAVEYHLITCLGRDGVSVTVATTGVVTLANHGMRAGHPIRMTATTFPGGAVANTTYYVSATDLTTGAFKVSATNGGAPLTFSSTGSGVKVIGEYWATLPATDPGGGGNYRARYGSAGSERVFRSASEWKAAQTALANPKIELVVEIEGAWTDLSSESLQPSTAWYNVVITSKINGIFGSAYHAGVIGAGYTKLSTVTAVRFDGGDCTVEGLELITTSTSHAVIPTGSKTTIRWCIIKSTGGHGISQNSALHEIYGNLIHSCGGTGIPLASYNSGQKVYNNTIIGCSIGIASGGTSNVAYIVNNVCIGNTTNWGTLPSGGLFANNAGLSTDSVWTSSGESRVDVTSADFANYVVPVDATSDFRPAGDSVAHTSSSALVDAAEQIYASMLAFDLVNNVRPSYKNESATNWDIGAYEFDWGYGLEPLQVTIAISGMAEGSVMAVYKTSDGSTIISPTTIGASGSYSITYSYTGDTQIEVVVRKGTSGVKYLPYTTPGLITATGFSLIVNQVIDGVLNG